MASASMPINSGITPIFSDVEAKTITDYFGNLIRKQSNYLTIENLDFFNNFIGEKLLQVDKLYNNNNSKSRNIKKLNNFWILFDNTIQSYKVNILGEKNKNNIKELNNSSKTELISIITSLIHILIKEYILNPTYFNQTQLFRTLLDKSFIFIKDDELKSILDNIDSKRFLSIARASMEISGPQHVATQKALEASQAAIVKQQAVQAGKHIVNNVINKSLADRLYALGRKGGMRKLTKNKTIKNKTIKHKTTKNKTTKNKTIKNKKLIVKK
jgi:hypothetical protein